MKDGAQVNPRRAPVRSHSPIGLQRNRLRAVFFVLRPHSITMGQSARQELLIDAAEGRNFLMHSHRVLRR